MVLVLNAGICDWQAHDLRTKPFSLVHPSLAGSHLFMPGLPLVSPRRRSALPLHRFSYLIVTLPRADGGQNVTLHGQTNIGPFYSVEKYDLR